MRRILVCLALAALSACAPGPSYEWYETRCEALGGEVHLRVWGTAECRIPDWRIFGDTLPPVRP